MWLWFTNFISIELVFQCFGHILALHSEHLSCDKVHRKSDIYFLYFEHPGSPLNSNAKKFARSIYDQQNFCVKKKEKAKLFITH